MEQDLWWCIHATWEIAAKGTEREEMQEHRVRENIDVKRSVVEQPLRIKRLVCLLIVRIVTIVTKMYGCSFYICDLIQLIR